MLVWHVSALKNIIQNIHYIIQNIHSMYQLASYLLQCSLVTLEACGSWRQRTEASLELLLSRTEKLKRDEWKITGRDQVIEERDMNRGTGRDWGHG